MGDISHGLPQAGEIKPIFKKFGKEMIEQVFAFPDGKSAEYVMMRAKNDPACTIVLPITTDGYVLAINQFRYGANELVLEIPGGVPKGNQSPEETLMDELAEETGYRPGRIVWLADGRSIWFDPASVRGRYAAALALDCVKVGEGKLDKGEFIETVKIPIKEWLEKAVSGGIVDSKTLGVTFLALPYLDFNLVNSFDEIF